MPRLLVALHVAVVFDMHRPRMEPLVVVRCPSVVGEFPVDVMVPIAVCLFPNAVFVSVCCFVSVC